MPRKYTKPASRVAPIFLAVWAARLLRKVERDYEEQERLSPEASAVGWALYLVHAALTASASLRRRRPLPVGETLSVALGGASVLLGSYLFAAGVREFRSFEQMSGVEQGELEERSLPLQSQPAGRRLGNRPLRSRARGSLHESPAARGRLLPCPPAARAGRGAAPGADLRRGVQALPD
jgi:hypothetical protein